MVPRGVWRRSSLAGLAGAALLVGAARAPAEPSSGGASRPIAASDASTSTSPSTSSSTPSPASPPVSPVANAEVRLALGASGDAGAWLVAGPFRADVSLPEPRVVGGDPAALHPLRGATVGTAQSYAGKAAGPARWSVAASASPVLDLKGFFGAAPTRVVAYAGGTLHLERAAKVLLLLGVDDGVRVFVDGRAIHARNEARPLRADDDAIPLDLSEGDHTVVLELAQRDGAWAFRARFVDASLAPLPGASFVLPGTTADDARALAQKMASVSFSRTFDGLADPPRYRPTLEIRYAAGAPREEPLPVTVRFVPASSDDAPFDLHAGNVAVRPDGVASLEVALPPSVPFKGSASLEVDVAGKTFALPFLARPVAERALARASRALRQVDPGAPWLRPGSLDSVTFLTDRLSRLVANGDTDLEAQTAEARELDALAGSLERGVDPYEGRTGPMRRALRSRFDGQLSEFGLYLPPDHRLGSGRTYPLVVGLHGLNGRAMGMMRWLFGGDDLGPGRGATYQDRHLGTLPPVSAIVVTPHARGNAFYREIGEVDVFEIVDWATRTFPVDRTRMSITGASMGGTGAASIPLHVPNVFAAAEPLCGYHSYRIRQDVRNYRLRPWEKFLVEERSNADWAENGERLPLWIVHGTRDLPERNSGVLIEAYEKLGFSVKHDHPDLGHNVWQPTYENLRGLNWLLSHKLDPKPSHVRFKTSRTRWGTSAWITIDALADEAGWGDIDARVGSGARITASTHGIAALRFDRATSPIGEGGATVVIDGQSLAWDASEPIVLHREPGGAWQKGPLAGAGTVKGGHVTGPLRDVFHEPILFVYGDAPDEARANELVARAFAHGHPGVEFSYPVMSDTAFFAAGEALGNERALFLVGRTNRVRDALERRHPGAFPIRVEPGAVTIGSERRTGRELGAAFVHPNPERPDRYLVVLAGADTAGTLRALSLPDLLPDFVVWDASLAPSRGQVVLGNGALLAGGFFTNAWKLPASMADPLAPAASRGAHEP